ncbi:MAG: tRNA (adenosine(37)-N6)-dimethylallyltransferase MiaA [Lewinellaceae bacterium]|nr:tRNA (adenosine(37)-N6)-dimethylallyltransferase MiaA [Lewinellaceae bacterium]
MKRLIVIGGATASGKTALAIRLARELNTVILSADSRQFYREMNIGTAKPSPEELALAKHYFIDSLSISEDYSVGNFEQDALVVLDEVFQVKDEAILVGGSGLYLNAVCEGLDKFPEISKETRSKVEIQNQTGGLPWLQATLQLLDPEYFDIVDQQNPARLRRAIEVCLETGNTFTFYRKNNKSPRSFTPLYILLDIPREELYTRIEARVDQMLEDGLEQEVESLLPYRDNPALKTVGYEEFFDFFDGKISKEEAVVKIKQHTRNYAKRQATWFRKHGNWTTFNPISEENDILKYVRDER